MRQLWDTWLNAKNTHSVITNRSHTLASHPYLHISGEPVDASILRLLSVTFDAKLISENIPYFFLNFRKTGSFYKTFGCDSTAQKIFS